MEIWNNIWPYAVAVLLFLTLVIIHEFGHFIAAKLFKVKVNEFAVGFGPKLLAKKWGETTYKLNLIPLGGYCAMEGEDEESKDEGAFCNKAPFKRFIIVVAGAVFNLIFGLIIVAIILAGQKSLTTTTVARFHENAVSVNYGLQVGDVITHVDGRRMYTTNDLSYAFSGVENGTVDMVVKRNGESVKLNGVQFHHEEENGIDYIKVDFYVLAREKNLGTFLGETFKTTFSYVRTIWFSLIDLITGKYGLSAMSGPVGLTVAIGDVARQSLKKLLPIIALITVNLGVFNLLPLPALDGGRLVFILFEMIFRKKVPEKFEGIVHGIGFALLLMLMLVVTAKDIWGLFV